MKITETWKTNAGPTISFEIFPARTDKGESNLNKAIDKLAELKPDFVSVTFGAGGSTRKGSYKLVQKLKKEKGLNVLPYFACFGLGPDEITSVMDSYRDLGVDNILAVRGDPPQDLENFTPQPQSMTHASDLITFLKKHYDLCFGAAAYPEGHIEAQSREKDLEYLKLKVWNGAEFIIANYFYDNHYFLDFIKRCREIGIEVPILPGIMPIYNVKMMKNLANLCGATITDQLKAGIDALPEGDKKALVDFGVDFALNQCRGLLEHGVPGLHFYTMDRSKSVVRIINKLREEGLV